jgi:hypothetical protein
MLYAALTFWLLVIMFAASGVHRLWSGLLKPKVVNSVLLPGTLVAQLGHVLGLLVTGNPVSNTKLMGDSESGAPESETPKEQRIPIIGPIVIGLLPLVACGVCLYLAATYLGGSVLAGLGTIGVPAELPRSLPGVWELLRGAITSAESLVVAIQHSDLPNWTTVLFLYLAVCLTVRMAPFEGNRRGAIGAMLLAGVVIAVIDSLPTGARGFVQSSWAVLSFSVATLLLLLLLSLAVVGVVGLIRILARNE